MTLPRRRRHPERRPAPADDALVKSMLRVGAARPGCIGHALAALRAARGQTTEQQADGFGITLAGLAHLSLARAPRPGHRADDLAAVAGRIGIAAGVLTAALEEAGRLGRRVAADAEGEGAGDDGE